MPTITMTDISSVKSKRTSIFTLSGYCFARCIVWSRVNSNRYLFDWLITARCCSVSIIMREILDKGYATGSARGKSSWERQGRGWMTVTICFEIRTYRWNWRWAWLVYQRFDARRVAAAAARCRKESLILSGPLHLAAGLPLPLSPFTNVGWS